MQSVDGDVRLSVDLDTGPVSNTIRRLHGKFMSLFKVSGGSGRELSSEFDGATRQMSELEVQIEKTRYQLEKLYAKRAEMASTEVPTTEYTTIQNEIEKTKSKIDSLKAKQQKFLELGGSVESKTYRSMQYDVEELSHSLRAAEGELQNLIDEGNAFTLGSGDIRQVDLDIAAAEAKLERLQGDYDNTADYQITAFERVKDAANRLMGVLGSVVRVGWNGFKGLASAVGKCARGISNLRKHAKGLGDVNKSVKSLIKNVLKWGLGIRSMFVLIRKLRTYAKEAFNTMAATATEVKDAMAGLKGSFSTFKLSLGTMLQPLLQAVVPILTTLINLFTQAANAIGAFFAAMTGQHYIYKAINNNNAYADSMEDVAGAAGKANDKLGEYDKLQVIQQDSGGGGGSGAGAGMFEQVGIPEGIANLVEMIKEGWRKGDLSELGSLIGNKIKNALDGIDWSGIQEKAQNVASALATLINGFISVDGLGYSIGNSIAQAIRTAVLTIDKFVTTVEWEKVGQFIADGINGFAKSGLIQDFAQTLVDVIEGAIDLLNGLITSIDWQEVGKAIAEAFNKIDWGKLVLDVAELAANIVKALLDAIKAYFENANTQSKIVGIIMLGFAAAKFTSGMFAAAAGGIFGAFSAALVTAFAGFEFGKWLYENTVVGDIVDTTIEAVADQFGVSADPKSDFEVDKDVFTNKYGGSEVKGRIAATLKQWNELRGFSGTEANIKAQKAMAVIFGQLTKAEYDAIYGAGEFDREMERMKEVTSKADDEVGSLVTAAQWLTDDLDAANRRISTLAYTSKTASTQVANLGKTSTSASTQIKTLGVYGTSTSTSLTELSKKTDQGASSIDNLGKKANSASTALSTLNSNSSTSSTAISTLGTASENSSKKVGTLGNTSSSTSTSLSGMKTNAAGASDKLANLSTNAKSADSNVNNLNSHAKSSSTALSNLGSAAGSGSTKLSQLSTDLKNTGKSAKEGAAETNKQADSWFSAGKNLVDGMHNGIQASWGTSSSTAQTTLFGKIKNLASTLTQTLKNCFGIKSPSREWAEVGMYLGLGLNVGLESESGRLLQTVDKLGTEMTETLADSLDTSVELPAIVQGQVLPANRAFLSEMNGSNAITTDNVQELFGTTDAKEPIIVQLPNGRVLAELVWDETAKKYKQSGISRTVFA